MRGLNKLKYYSIIKTKHLDSVTTEMKVKWCIGTCFLSKIIIINKIPIGNFSFFQTGVWISSCWNRL